MLVCCNCLRFHVIWDGQTHTHTPHGCQTTNAFKRILCFFVSLLFVICLLCICLLHWSDTADQRNRAFVNRNSHAAQKQRAHTLKHIHFDWILANVKLKQQQQTAIGRKKNFVILFLVFISIYTLIDVTLLMLWLYSTSVIFVWWPTRHLIAMLQSISSILPTMTDCRKCTARMFWSARLSKL